MSEETLEKVAEEEKTVERDLVINSRASEVDIALLEDNTLVELHREKTNNQFAVGDVYLGRVKKILPGLNAAFVDVGYPKEAFLHYLDLGLQAHTLLRYKKMVVAGDDVAMDKFKLEPDLPKNGKISDMLTVGDLIPVQIAKEPIHTKGPRITAEISFAGRYLVLVPFSNRISVSQKIRSSEERNRLRRLIQSIRPNNYGVIIRTIAEGKKVAELDADLKSLIGKWEQCTVEMKKMTTFGKMVSEMDQTSVMLRDLLNESFSNIRVNDETLYEDIRNYIQTIAPQKADIVQLYSGKEPIFDHYNVAKQIKGFFGRIVTIKNGVYLVIEHRKRLPGQPRSRQGNRSPAASARHGRHHHRRLHRLARSQTPQATLRSPRGGHETRQGQAQSAACHRVWPHPNHAPARASRNRGAGAGKMPCLRRRGQNQARHPVRRRNRKPPQVPPRRPKREPSDLAGASVYLLLSLHQRTVFDSPQMDQEIRQVVQSGVDARFPHVAVQFPERQRRRNQTLKKIRELAEGSCTLKKTRKAVPK